MDEQQKYNKMMMVILEYLGIDSRYVKSFTLHADCESRPFIDLRRYVTDDLGSIVGPDSAGEQPFVCPMIEERKFLWKNVEPEPTLV